MLGELRANLRLISRELADARALTWSPDLSDSLGRSQLEVKRLVDAAERAAIALEPLAIARNSQATALNPAEAPAQWPYLAG